MTLEDLLKMEEEWMAQPLLKPISVSPIKIIELIRCAREAIEKSVLLVAERDGAISSAAAAKRERDFERSQVNKLTIQLNDIRSRLQAKLNQFEDLKR